MSPTVLETNALYQNIYSLISWVLPDSLSGIAGYVAGLAIVLFVANIVLVITPLFIWFERRILGRFQQRLGPNRWGPFGLLQPIADAIKLIIKEDIIPRGADRPVFNAAPVILFMPVMLMIAVIPFGTQFYLVDLNVGVLYIIAVGTLETIGIFMAGWASGNRYALMGAVRSVAMLVSYEVPLVMSLAAVLLWTGSMSLVDIVDKQPVPLILLQPLGFFVFITATIAEMNRAPFDLIEAESEIVAGYHTEYSGMKFGVFQLAEFASVVVGAGFITAIFLKGAAGWAFLPSPVWFSLKWLAVIFCIIWIRATLPRVRVDQVMAFAWKFLLPLSAINLIAIAVEIVLWPSPGSTELWIIGLANFAIAGIAIFALATALGHRNFSAREPQRPIRNIVSEKVI
jgi:NADH-quinone oxidoreductase subunit H